MISRSRGSAAGGDNKKGPPLRQKMSRVPGAPETARASKRSKQPEIQKVFDLAVNMLSSSETLSLRDLLSFMADYLGFGEAEVFTIFNLFGDAASGMNFDAFTKAYPMMNPFMLIPHIGKIRSGEAMVRKVGSLGGLKGSSQQASLEYLEDCEVYICTVTAQAFVDDCKRSVIMFGPCESSVFVRNCEDCVFWLATQQLRTRDCKNCKFFLYSKTEPVIESSEDLAFAPWCAEYPGCGEHFQQARFDRQRNMWNAVFDFSGKPSHANWRIMPMEEVCTLRVELPNEEVAGLPSKPNGLGTPITYEALCADPLASEESCGQSMGNIPQTRPSLPPAPKASFGSFPTLVFRDQGLLEGRKVGADYVSFLLRL